MLSRCCLLAAALAVVGFSPAPAQAIRSLTGHRSAVTAVVFLPVWQRLDTASFDHTIKVWDAARGELLAGCKGHNDKVTALAYRPDGRVLASAGLDRTIRLW